MNPEALLTRLSALGLKVEPSQHPGMVVVSPAERLTPDLMEEIAAHKAELLALLAARQPPLPAPVAWRVTAMRPQLPPFPRPAPLLLARDRPYAPGQCLSCGDPIPAPRCAPCQAAAALVLAEWRRGSPG